MKILKGMIVVEKATGKTLVVENVKDGVLYLSNNTKVPERLVREVFSSGEYPDGFQFNAELVDGKLIVNGSPINTGSLKIQKIVAQCNGQLYLTVESVKHRDKIDVFCYDLKMDQFEKVYNSSCDDAKALLNQKGLLVYQLENSAEHTMGVTENDEPIVGVSEFTETIMRYKECSLFRKNSAEVGADFGDIRDVRTNGESTVILALSNMRPVTMTDINGEKFVTFEDVGKPVTASIFRLRTRVNEFGEEVALDYNAFKPIRTDVVGEVKDWEYYPGLNAYVLKGTKGVSVITFADGDKKGKVRDFCFDVSLLDDADVMSVDLGDRRNSITIGKIADDGTVSAKKVVVTYGTDRGYVTEVIDL